MKVIEVYKDFEEQYKEFASDTIRSHVRSLLKGYGITVKKPTDQVSDDIFMKLQPQMREVMKDKVPGKKPEPGAAKKAAKPAPAPAPEEPAKPKVITSKVRKQEKQKEEEARVQAADEKPADEKPAVVIVKKKVLPPRARQAKEPVPEASAPEAPAPETPAPEAPAAPAPQPEPEAPAPAPEQPAPAAEAAPAPEQPAPAPAPETAAEPAPAPEPEKAPEPEQAPAPEQPAPAKAEEEQPAPAAPAAEKPARKSEQEQLASILMKTPEVKPVSSISVEDFVSQNKDKENLPRVSEIVPLDRLKGWRPPELGRKKGGKPEGKAPAAAAPGQPPMPDMGGATGRKDGGRKGKKDSRTSREEMLGDALRNSKGSQQSSQRRGAFDDEGEYRHHRGKARKAPGAVQPTKAEIVKGDIKVSVPINVRDFSQEIGVKVGDIIKVFFKMGEMLTINSPLDEDHVILAAAELGVNVSVKSKEENLEESTFSEEGYEEEMTAEEAPRAPVVVFMGHVDHGKTSLIDAIRATKVAAGESGGITQHIGAYEVDTSKGHITIIDTPGHEAFTTMRARGANSTDIAVLVVAADDGVMPQTLEAINHARAANVALIVAVNKMDLPGANPERVIRQLSENNILVEDWGGEVQCVKVSAHTGEGLDNLLEAISLQAGIMELKARAEGPAEGVVLEAELNPGRGTSVTLLVQKGRLKLGDPIVCGTSYAKARALSDYSGRSITEAGPSQPVQILGFNEVPQPGAKFRVAASEKLARELTEKRAEEEQLKRHAEAARATLESFYKNMKSSDDIKELALIVKGDTKGTTEAVKAALERLTTEDAKVTVIHSGVGDVTENDVMLASASNGVVIAFKTSVMEAGRALAKSKGVEIRQYDVIYHATEQIEKALKGLLEPTFHEEETGTAEIRMLFKLPSGVVAGSYVTGGEIHRTDKARIYRGNEVIYEGEIQTLRHLKDDVKEVRSGYECGIVFKDFNDLKEGDRVRAFKMVQDGLGE